MKINELLNEDWQKANKSDKTDGMSSKAVKAYRRENPGSKLKTAVTTKPSKLKKGSKAAKRRKSFCARMSGNKGPMKKPNGKPTPKALALRRWNCESVEEMAQMILEGQQMIAEIKKGAKDSNGVSKCWSGYHAAGTKKSPTTGKSVRNCVKNEDQGVAEGHADQQRKVFKKNGETVGEVGIDRESSPGNGQYYMKCYKYNIDNAGYDSYEEAVAELKHCLKQGVAEGQLAEKWTQKYKSSINCSHPKGFSQKAHCAGRKKNEGIQYEMICPDCGTSADSVVEEAKRGLYYNVNKRKAAGTSRSASSPKAPTAQAWKDAAKTAKK